MIVLCYVIMLTSTPVHVLLHVPVVGATTQPVSVHTPVSRWLTEIPPPPKFIPDHQQTPRSAANPLGTPGAVAPGSPAVAPPTAPPGDGANDQAAEAAAAEEAAAADGG